MNAEIDISNVTLKTARLVLRPFLETDLEDFFEYASVDGVGQPAGWTPHRDRAESGQILARFISGKKTFALVHGGKVVGSLGVEKYDEERFPQFASLRCREIGYILAKSLWGRGLMCEAVNAVLDYLFNTVGLDAVLCGNFLTNSRSARVQLKCGFRHLDFGTFTSTDGVVHSDEQRIITREEYAAMHK